MNHIEVWENEGGNFHASSVVVDALEEKNKHYHDLVERARHQYDPQHLNPHGIVKYKNRHARRAERRELADTIERQDW